MHDSLLMHGLVCCTETILGYKIQKRTNKLTAVWDECYFITHLWYPVMKFVDLLLLEADWKILYTPCLQVFIDDHTVLTLTEGWCKSFEASNSSGSKIVSWHDSECATECLLHAVKLKDHFTFLKKTSVIKLRMLLQFLYRDNNGFEYLLYSILHYSSVLDNT